MISRRAICVFHESLLQTPLDATQRHTSYGKPRASQTLVKTVQELVRLHDVLT